VEYALKRVISLDGVWKLQYFDFGVSMGQFREDYDDSWWLDAKVPGEIHETLLNYGLIEDPFYGKNCDKREWVERVDWWYRHRFYVPEELRGKRVILVFEGLDTFAKVWLNGKRVADSEDMFIPISIDVSEKLRYGDFNILAVRLGAPWYETLRRAGDFSERNLLWNGSYARLYVRKAQYQYGWDWAVKLLTAGIWRSVKLIAYDVATINDVYVKTLSIDEEKAEIEITVEIDSRSNANALLKIDGECGDSKFHTESPLTLREECAVYNFVVNIEKPRLWWPLGYGKPSLYNLHAELIVEGKIEDEHNTRFGIRTVELVTESFESENGKVFYIKINGVKVFCKGANWIPADLLISRLNRSRYESILRLAAEGNHNMLRVWGGGLVEYDEFYDICDEFGIMLWHDFNFACGHYPDGEDFLNLVRKEAEATIRRLRNHPSIVLWCGNNENEIFDFVSGYGLTSPEIDFEVLPNVVSKMDPSRPYWPSSPWGGENPNDMVEGDRHNWEVYHGMAPISDYLKDEARFLSEFGMQAAPHIKTMLKFLSSSSLWPVNENWLYHYHVPEKVIPYMKDYGEPRHLYEYVFLSMLVQSEALKTAIEHCRRRKFKCGGVLYWSFNAPWPNMCWETVDYYGLPKMGFYFAKRAFEPIIVSPLHKNGIIEVWIVNDTLSNVKCRLKTTIVNLADAKSSKTLVSEHIILANSSSSVIKHTLSDLNITDVAKFLVVFDIEADDKTHRNVLLLTKHKELQFPNAILSLEASDIIKEGDELTLIIKVGSDKYARLVNVDVKEDYIVTASDNYFDLLPGETKNVKVNVKNFEAKELTLVASAFNAERTNLKIELPFNN
jgi:beta-mannosidase